MEKDERAAGREGERKNGGKRRRILSRFQIKDQTNRSTPSAGCVSFFSIPFCPRAYPPFFFPSLLPLSFSPVWPFWPPPWSLFSSPESSQVSEARAIRKSRTSMGPDSRPPRCYPKRGRKEGGRIGEWSNLANDSARFVRLMWFDWQRKYKDLFPLANICQNKIIFLSYILTYIIIKNILLLSLKQYESRIKKLVTIIN